MSSRKQAQNKPYWKRRAPDTPGYVREFASHEDGTPAVDPVTNERIYRDRPNRKMKRISYSLMRKDLAREITTLESSEGQITETTEVVLNEPESTT